MKISKEDRISRLDLIGMHLEKYRLMLSIALIAFILFIVGLIIYWNFDENNISPLIDNTYLISQIIIGVISIGMLFIFLLNKKGIVNRTQLVIISHIYSLLLLVWSAAMSIMDLKIGSSPIVYMITAGLVSSLFILEPIFFTVIALGTYFSIVICAIIFQYNFFANPYGVENIIYFIVYGVIIIISAFRHFNVIYREHKALKEVERLTYHDPLTDLLNERSYINKVEQLNDDINENKNEPFAVIMMDVNNLKATNDQYGHRFGCNLIVTTGHILPTLFKTSSLFHVGGDEFIAIVEGEDYLEFDNRLKEFDEKLRFGYIKYEDIDLILSVARGYAKYQEGDRFQDVLQRADNMMYKNKEEIKKTYNLKGR